MKDFRDLEVWKKSHNFVLKMYEVLLRFPRNEQFELVSQMKRAAISIPANISESCGKYTDKDKANFIQIAIGSASEIEYYLLLSRELNYIDDLVYSELLNQIQEIKKMLIKFVIKLRSS